MRVDRQLPRQCATSFGPLGRSGTISQYVQKALPPRVTAMWSITSDLEGALRAAGLGSGRQGWRSRQGAASSWSRAQQAGATRRSPRVASAVSPTCRPASIGAKAAVQRRSGLAGPYPADMCSVAGIGCTRSSDMASKKRSQGVNARGKPDATSASPWPLSLIAEVDFAQVSAADALEVCLLQGDCCSFVTPSTGRGATPRINAHAGHLHRAARQNDRSGDAHHQEVDEPEARHLMPRGSSFKPRTLRPSACCCLPRGDRVS